MPFQLSLRGQIVGLLGGSLVLLLLIALGCFRLLAGGVENYRHLMGETVAASQLVDRANLEFKVQVQEWKNVLLRGRDAKARDRYWSQFQEQEKAVQELLGILASKMTGDEALQASVKALQQEHRAMGEAYRKGLDAFVQAGGDPAAGDAAVKGIDRAASEQMKALVDTLHARSDTEAAAIGAQAERTVRWGVGVLVLAGVLICMFSLWLVNLRLVAPIRQLIHHIAQLSRGNFLERAEIVRSDELGELASATNTLRDFLRDTFQQLQRSVQALDQTSEALATVASQMTGGVQEQFSRTDMVATAMHEMSATAQEVARHAAEAASSAGDADHAARQGGQVMAATITTIDGIQREIVNTADVIRVLEEDSARVGRVLEVIRGIAEQTNLLALNASIEAARAGDAGRGFAVVADEVRSLARRTSESTTEIHQIIDSVQGGALNAVRAIESGRQRSEAGVTQVGEAGQSLQHIIQAIEAIRDMNRQIATAAEEQTAVVDDISRNLTEITAIASSNQQHVQRAETASQSLRQLSGDLTAMTRRLMSA